MKITVGYADMLTQTLALRGTTTGPEYRVAVLSNITVGPLVDFLEYIVISLGLNVRVLLGDFDSIIQDSERFRDANLVVVFWEVSGLVDGLHYRAEVMDAATREQLLESTTQRLDLLARNLTDSSLVLMNRFSTLPFAASALEETGLETITRALNEYLARIAPRSFRLVDLDRVISKVSVARCMSWRDFYAAKAPYTLEFYRAYVEHVAPLISAALGKGRKALVFDCDNTLWKGVVGEDGIDGIQMSPSSAEGAIFREIQTLALGLKTQGVLLGICSKNNADDVDQVLEAHPDMVIRNSDLAVKVVNWSDKAENLLQIARNLNIGLDAIVFVDDSEFEINLIRQRLPDVCVIQVPRRLHDYPSTIRDAFRLFTQLSRTAEDVNRGRMYSENREREIQRSQFGSVEDYLRSLDLKVNVAENDISLMPRLAQLTQKTNQFNVTTRRYTESNIERMMRDGRHWVIGFSVADRFGDSGLTGLCIIGLDADAPEAELDTMLMSCRVIGRNVELAFFDFLAERLIRRGLEVVRATYRRTQKNSQVSEFYEKLGFSLVTASDAEKHYLLRLSEYRPTRIGYIEVSDGRSN